MSRNWFIALRVPAGSWFERVVGPPPGVRIFHPEDLHITVAFLGPVEREAADAAFRVAPKWPTGVLDVSLSAVSPMGNPRHPAALAAVAAEGGDRLNAAIASVRAKMCELAGARTDDRPPRAHVTVARLRRRSSRSDVAAAVRWGSSIDLGNPRLQLCEIVLYRGTADGGERRFAGYDVYALPDDPVPT